MEEARDEEIEMQEIPDEDEKEIEEKEAEDDKEKDATEETPTVTLRPLSELTLEVVSCCRCCFFLFVAALSGHCFEFKLLIADL